METVGTASLAANQPPRFDHIQKPPEAFFDESGRCPVDLRTGLPLPIAPAFNIAALPQDQVNEHHHFYPRLSPTLTSTLGGKALRVSRIQRVEVSQHNFGDRFFHKYFPEGAEIPKDAARQLGMCVLACAGYVPEQVVDTSDGKPLVRPMEYWEFNRLRRPGMYVQPQPYQVKRFRDKRHPGLTLLEAKTELVNSRRRQAEMTYHNLLYGFDPIRKFIVQQVLNQDYSVIRHELRDRFLSNDELEAGLCILAIGTGLAARAALVKDEPLDTTYSALFKEGRLHSKMPATASTLIKHKLGQLSDRIELLPQLKVQLMTPREQRVA